MTGYEIPDGMWPIAVVQDRYNGTYVGRDSHHRGTWLAVAQADFHWDDLMNGPHGGDGDAMVFWNDPPKWISAGNTPDEAVANLVHEYLVNKDQSSSQSQTLERKMPKNFVNLHRLENGNRIPVRPAHVSAFTQDDDGTGTKLYFHSGYLIKVKESVEEVERLFDENEAVR